MLKSLTSLAELSSLATKSDWRNSVVSEAQTIRRAVGKVGPWAIRSRLGRADSLLQVTLDNARKKSNDLAFQMGDRKMTWKQLADATSRVAHVLADSGVGPGDRVAVVGYNSPFYLALVLGTTRVGATAALINHHLVGNPLRHAIQASRAKVAVVDARLENALCSSLDPKDELK